MQTIASDIAIACFCFDTTFLFFHVIEIHKYKLQKRFDFDNMVCQFVDLLFAYCVKSMCKRMVCERVINICAFLKLVKHR